MLDRFLFQRERSDIPQPKSVSRFYGTVFSDEESYTTLDNAQHASQQVREIVATQHDGDWSRVRVIVCCRLQQSFKSWLLYWLLLPELRVAGMLKIHAVDWEELRRENPFVELVKIFVDLAGVYVPPIRRITSWLRKRSAKKR